MSENAAIFVRQPSLSRTDTTPTCNDLAFSLHQAGLRGDSPKERNLELERCLRKPLVQHGPDREPHAAIEQRGSKAAMNSAGRVEMTRMRFCGGNNVALGNLDDVIAERLRHRVQGQRAVDEPLNKFETTHCTLLIVIHDPKTFPSRRFPHGLHTELVGNAAPIIGSRRQFLF